MNLLRRVCGDEAMGRVKFLIGTAEFNVELTCLGDDDAVAEIQRESQHNSPQMTLRKLSNSGRNVVISVPLLLKPNTLKETVHELK